LQIGIILAPHFDILKTWKAQERRFSLISELKSISAGERKQVVGDDREFIDRQSISTAKCSITSFQGSQLWQLF
jgi:hypothetical protein